jgi:hypothetical protein
MTLDPEQEEFMAMFFALREDAVHWLPSGQAADDPYRRRAFVRATLAFLEGTGSAMKRLALAMHEAGQAEFSPAELAILREETYELSDRGEPKTRVMKIRTLENVRFAVRSFAHAHQLDASLRVDGAGWQAVQQAIRIRDRLVHPRVSTDLTVTDDEIEIVNAAGKWFQDAVMELFTALAGEARSRILRLAHQSLFDERAR